MVVALKTRKDYDDQTKDNKKGHNLGAPDPHVFKSICASIAGGTMRAHFTKMDDSADATFSEDLRKLLLEKLTTAEKC